MGRIDVYPSGSSGSGSGTTIAQQPDAPSPFVNSLWIDTDEGTGGVGLSSILAYTEITSSTTTAAAAATVDVPGLEVTVTVPAGRRLRITGKFIGYATVLPARVASTIREGTTVLGNFEAQPTATNMGVGLHAEAIVSPSAGSHTYKMAITAATNTGFVYADSSLKGWILVEDITGTLWPAGASIGIGAIASEAWTNYTPVWTSSGTQPSLGNGALTGRYTKIGRTVHGNLFFRFGSTSTAGTGAWFFSLPIVGAGALTPWIPIGIAYAFDSGPSNGFNGIVRVWGDGLNNKLHLVYPATWPTGTETSIGPTTPFTWATTDDFSCYFTYESAT